ncbi:MAG TPA: hypothetical protein VFQ32_00970 [Ktedonobacterales bacterium]|nr:hypothetical protein [Ktedonobacterales bacterium]
MDELVNQVCQKTGISQDQAQQAVQTVIGYLKDRLPGPIGSQLDNVLGGQGGPGGIAGQAGQALGGMFGGGNNPNPNS